MTPSHDTIDLQSKLPLYHQLYTILHKKLDVGEWKPGDVVPPESELIVQYQVSRTTVRQVLDLLVKEGLIYRERGRGTFVAHRSLEQTLSRIVSFTEDMRQRGFTPGSQMLAAELLAAPPELAARLDIHPGEELAHIHRLRLADGEPMAVEESFLVHKFFPGIMAQDYTNRSLYQAVMSYDIRWSRARQAIRAVPATAAMARLLGIKPQAALLFLERISYTQRHLPAELLRIHYRGDRYTLFAELSG